MEDLLSIASISFFYISVGAQRKYCNGPLILETGRIIAGIICLLALICPVISYCILLGIKWYWSILLNLIGFFVISNIITSIYCSLLGIRTKVQYSLTKQKHSREHLYEFDMLITIGIAILFFVCSLI